MPSRSMIRSLTSTSSQSSSSAQVPVLPPRESSRQSSPQPDLLSLSPLSLTKQITRTTTRSHGAEDLDEMGYIYSLRVALLQQRLDQASSKAPLSPPLSSPSFLDSSPDLPPSPRSSSRGSPAPMSKRKSAFGLNKKTSDELKLPKELLVEFWSVLEAEHGDQGWTAIVSAFLRQIRKGTKTPSGMNLRHIPVLLDAFSQVASTESRASHSMHEHQSHLVQLLHNFLPRSSYFSPLARGQSEKDKDLLFRLRAEVQSYMGSQDSIRSSVAPSSIHLSPSLNEDRRGQHRASFAKHVDYVAMVGEVWGVPHEVMSRDIARIGELGPLEKVYMLDLKKTLSIPAIPYSALDKSRLASASQQLADLLARSPQLAELGNAAETLPPTPPFDPSSSLFVPVDRVKVFNVLRRRGAGRTDELLDACRQIWMVPTRQQLEMEVADLHRVWAKSIGGQDENKVATSLAPAIQDLIDDLQGQPSPALRALQDDLFNLLEKSIDTIFPITSAAPTRPPPSLLYLFAAGREVFFDSGAKDLDDVRDRLKGEAVQEYVVAAQAMMEPHGSLNDAQMVSAYAKIASWIESEIANVKKIWGSGLGEHLNPATVILGKQLPLFCAELQTLDKPQTASEMFALYDSVSRLVDMWQDLCTGHELGFEIHSFFEPHVKAWLRQTDTHAVQDCVSRAVGMDRWHRQGEAMHSQSVTDLFQFINASLKTVQEDLPLSNYRRGVYLTDLSKIISAAVTQYANTVNALFMAEIAPPKVANPTMELQAKLGGKAGSWLAKGQQAVKSLEKKKVDGFVVPPTACTKLMDICESQTALENIIATIDVPKTTQMKSLSRDDMGGGHTITVTIMRGSGLLSKSSAKGADAFVVVDYQEAARRLWKTQTVLGAENPRWDETFEVAINQFAHLNVSVYDRQLVGKHTLICSATLKLDKRSFASASSRDETISLSPRGSIQVRLSIDNQSSGDPNQHLSSAMRTLQRTEKDMLDEIIDQIDEVIRQVLSRHTLESLSKLAKDKKRVKGALTDGELEHSLGSLFECLNANFLIFSSTLDPVTRISLMLDVWHRVLECLISLLVPPLSDQPSTSRLLSPLDTEVVFKWLHMLKAFFNAAEADGTEHGVPISQLQHTRYRDLLMLGQYMDLPSSTLKDRCAGAVTSATSTGGNGERNDEGVRTAEVLLRLARTRPELGSFLGQQMGLLSRARGIR